MRVTINGEARELDGSPPSGNLEGVIAALGLKADRIAVELNGEIAPRAEWARCSVKDGDRLEIVHFVGGGAGGSSASAADQVREERLPAVSVVAPATEGPDTRERG